MRRVVQPQDGTPTLIVRCGRLRAMRKLKRPRLSGVEFEKRLRRWAEITELGLALRGAILLGGRGRTRARCIAAGLREANRIRLEQKSG